jgi:Ca2+-binding EF-hand superfamily protein
MSVEEIKAILNDDDKLLEIARDAFESVDTDGSGFIEQRELKEVMAGVASDVGMSQPSDADVDEVMRSLDANSDGKISLDEFKALIKAVLEMMIAG